ncbi:MAG: exo-alpha-sialidase [Phycisphaeraceae bacterium]|nr:exo-alpha-sialidase [Phycisphaeraceae bacterium]
MNQARCGALCLGLSAIALSGAAVWGEDGQPKPVALVESETVIFDYGNGDPYDLANLHGFNHATSVAALPDGRVMAMWFSGPYEASVHQSIMAADSDDGGRTWSKAYLFSDEPRTSDFDPAFIVNGDQVLAFFSTGRWTRWPFVGIGDAARKQVGTESFQIWMKRSGDSGRTWSLPQAPLIAPGWNCRSNGIRLSNGHLLLPLHYLQSPHRSAALLSEDGGKTWHISQEVAMPDKQDAAEPSAAQLSDGSLLMALRTRDGKLWFTRSHDSGNTWETPIATDISATSGSHSLFRHSSGKLVLVHNPGPVPLRTELTLRVSLDDGGTWSQPVLLASVEAPEEMPAAADAPDVVWSRQVSYPSVCELPDGKLVVVWGLIEMSSASQSGIIHAARVSLTE